MKKITEELYEILSVVMTAVITVTILFTLVFRIAGVTGTSMVPTLSDGDYLVTSALKKDYSYKDIIIIVQPGALNEPLVKRVIATEGQWVTVNYDDGLVYVGDSKDNMSPLDENYTASLTNVHHVDDTNTYPVQVPDDCLFVMGDNRNDSTDSRSYLVGFIDKQYVLGKAEFRLFENGKFAFGNYELYDN